MKYSYIYNTIPEQDTYHGRGGRTLIQLPSSSFTCTSSDKSWLHYNSTPTNILVWADINTSYVSRYGNLTITIDGIEYVYEITLLPFDLNSSLQVSADVQSLTYSGGTVTYTVNTTNVDLDTLTSSVSGISATLVLDDTDTSKWTLTVPSTTSSSNTAIDVTFTVKDLMGNTLSKTISVTRKGMVQKYTIYYGASDTAPTTLPSDSKKEITLNNSNSYTFSLDVNSKKSIWIIIPKTWQITSWIDTTFKGNFFDTDENPERTYDIGDYTVHTNQYATYPVTNKYSITINK